MEPKKIILFDSFHDCDINNIDVYSSTDALTKALEFDSFSGGELAFFEDGERAALSVQTGRVHRDLLGREHELDDFKFIEAKQTGDYSLKEKFFDFLRRVVAMHSVAGTDVGLTSLVDRLILIVSSEPDLGAKI